MMAIAFLSLLIGAALRASANQTARLAAQRRSIEASTAYAGTGGARRITS
jgi:hypothetical protein